MPMLHTNIHGVHNNFLGGLRGLAAKDSGLSPNIDMAAHNHLQEIQNPLLASVGSRHIY